MSVNSYARAQRMHHEVETYFDKLEREAIPKALDDLNSLKDIRDEKDNVFLTDRHVNLIFKNKTLLKSAKTQEKLMRKRKHSELDDDSNNEDEEEEEEEETKLSFAHLGYTPKKFVHTDQTRRQLINTAKDHQAYLRRLRGKTWDKLTTIEQRKIHEYITYLQDFVRHLQEKTEYLNYMTTAVPLLQEIMVHSEEVKEDTEMLHSCTKSVTYKRTLEEDAKALIATDYIPLSSTVTCNVLDSYVINNESHDKLELLMKEFTTLVEYTLNLYGDVRGSGTVVQNATIPKGTVQPLTLIENKDAAIVSGLMCEDCGVMRVIDFQEASASCPKCGVTKPFQGQGEENFNFRDKPVVDKNKNKNYKPENYMIQWLRKVQGKLKTDIPESVWQILFKDFHQKRLRIVTPRIVRQTLKRFNMRQYYNCVPFITYKFNDVPLANFSDEEEVVLVKRFEEYKVAFEKCPMDIKQRSNLLSYSYFLRKTVEEMGWSHYMKCFPLLEGENNLRKHDRTWKWICENKDGDKWTYIPTI